MNKITKIIIFCFSLIFIFNACSNNDNESLFEETFLIVTHKKVEKFDNGKLSDKVTTYYFYDRKNDYFWNKAIIKDSSNKPVKTFNRTLDAQTRLPIKETILENGRLVKKNILKFSIDNYELLVKEEFNGDNKLRTTHYFYNTEGYLISKTDTSFKNSRIQNIDNVKYSIHIAKPKGYYPINGFISLKKVYSHGNIDTVLITKFDDLGYPIYDSLYIAGSNSKSNFHWYKTVVDDNKIEGLINYDDKDFKSSSAGDIQLQFEYNSDGFIENIEEMKYKEMSGEYEILNSSQTYDWIVPKFKSRYNFSDYNYTSISSCSNKNEHIKYEKKIVRFDDVGEKVVEEYSGKFKGDCNEDTEVKTVLIKRTTYIFNKLVIKGERAVIYRNKKVEMNIK